MQIWERVLLFRNGSVSGVGRCFAQLMHINSCVDVLETGPPVRDEYYMSILEQLESCYCTQDVITPVHVRSYVHEDFINNNVIIFNLTNQIKVFITDEM